MLLFLEKLTAVEICARVNIIWVSCTFGLAIILIIGFLFDIELVAFLRF